MLGFSGENIVSFFLRRQHVRGGWMASLKGQVKSSIRHALKNSAFMDYCSFLPRARIPWEIACFVSRRAC